MIIFRSTVYYVFAIIWCIFIGVACLPLLLLTQKFVFLSSRTWAAGLILLLRVICNLDYEVRGKSNIPRSGNFLIASKHQSAWDTFIFFLLIDRPVYILKRELIYTLPILSFYMIRMGCVPVNRKGGANALRKMVKDAVKALKKGRRVVIFPEGTRTMPNTNKSYQPGIVAIYKQADVDVLPVALNSGVYWKRNSFLKYPGKIILEFLPVIKPGLGKTEFTRKLENTIETKSKELYEEAVSS